MTRTAAPTSTAFSAVRRASPKSSGPRSSNPIRRSARTSDSQERKDLDQLFDSLQQLKEVHASDCLARDLPSSVKRILERHDANGMEDGEKSLLGLMYSCFGNPEDARKAMATYDNIESLLPQLGNVTGNSLARAALEKREGRTPKFSFEGPEYIEAQIQGPIMPLRDIAEIRVDMNIVPEEERKDYIQKMKDFERQTGIPVVFHEPPHLESSTPSISTWAS